MKAATLLRRAALTLTFGAMGAAFAMLPATAQAAGSESFQISPPTANYSGDRGHTVSGNIKVTNLTGQPMTVNVGKENFVAQGEEGQVELVNSADPLYSLAPWFNYDQQQLTVAPRATSQLNYTIAIPTGAEPGGRYGSITFSTIPPRLGSNQSGAAVEQTLASLIFLRINGAAKEQLSVSSFTTGHLGTKNSWTAKSFFEYPPVDFLARIKDSGNVHEQPTGTITIKNFFGSTVATLSLDQHFVIPGAIRRWHNTWQPKGFTMGAYTATLNATYAGKSLTATTSFTVIPYKLIAAIIIVLLILFFIVWRGRKRFGRAFRILAGRE